MVMNTLNQPVALIAVVGATGSGKSTFINVASGSNLRVGTSLESCTGEIAFGNLCQVSGKNVLLIDTPGFDDTVKTQADVLREIASFLKQSYEQGRLLTGIIYMHRITDLRVGGIARESFCLFRKTCGDDAMNNVVVVTNMWGAVEQQRGEERERELATKSLFFKDAIDRGARMLRHYNTVESAHAIIHQMLGNVPEVLKMQHEMVDEHKGSQTTEAGKSLQSELGKQAEKHQKEIRELQEEIKQLKSKGDKERNSYRQEVNDLKYAQGKLTEKMIALEKEKDKLLKQLDDHDSDCGQCSIIFSILVARARILTLPPSRINYQPISI
ncbi:hypothetical protein A0H81_13767 [Grifola frondosa]|uniref:G domain-containing protein n=1 Tax=Grifola frondosa TaxID=5627 RepID=A0A1C7LNR7_GRIFR|nr:hypothetical protein A0H81_13767 [Grifola frondosa]